MAWRKKSQNLEGVPSKASGSANLTLGSEVVAPAMPVVGGTGGGLCLVEGFKRTEGDVGINDEIEGGGGKSGRSGTCEVEAIGFVVCRGLRRGGEDG